ncbi:MAG: M48 family metalloprotease [Bacillota bacterium]
MKVFTVRLFFFVSLMAIGFSGAKAFAAPTDYLNPDYYLGKSIAEVLMLAGTMGYGEYKVVADPQLSQRLSAAQRLVMSNPFYNYRFKDIQVVVIQGAKGEPNAFSLGPVIFVTQSLGMALNDRQLTAVLTHEMAHSHEGHFAQRIPMPLGAIVYQATQLLISGRTSSPASLKNFTDMVRENIETVHLATEIQADCLAANQLNYLHQRGFANTASDLVDATNALYGEDVTELKDDYGDPGIIRAKIIKSNQYAIFGCNIF